jgi:redox-sensitive bicupin YhaK (pirin superfamily)
MLELRRSRDRGYDDYGTFRTFYTFSFADYYDPEHIDFGPLQVMNEARIKPGRPYLNQQRHDAEILTYVIEGELRHQDSLGNEVMLRAGSLQCISAGTGVNHAEINASAGQEAHLLYICIKPAKTGLPPAYGHKHFAAAEKRGALRLLASPDGENGSLVLHQDARVYGGLFHEAERGVLDLGRSRRAFLHVVRGSIAVNETRLNAGDGVKISPPAEVVLQHGREAEILVIEVPAGPQTAKRKSIPRLKSKSER